MHKTKLVKKMKKYCKIVLSNINKKLISAEKETCCLLQKILLKRGETGKQDSLDKKRVEHAKLASFKKTCYNFMNQIRFSCRNVKKVM